MKLIFTSHLTVCLSTYVTVLTLVLIDMLFYVFCSFKQCGFFDHLPLVLPRGDDVITGTLQCGVSFLCINENKTNVQTKQPLCEKNKTSKTQLQIQGRHDHTL